MHNELKSSIKQSKTDQKEREYMINNTEMRKEREFLVIYEGEDLVISSDLVGT